MMILIPQKIMKKVIENESDKMLDKICRLLLLFICNICILHSFIRHTCIYWITNVGFYRLIWMRYTFSLILYLQLSFFWNYDYHQLEWKMENKQLQVSGIKTLSRPEFLKPNDCYQNIYG